jgi:crotonobetainyl-CoA:carnitine CoA-transferase CaiB-like acyl-CoA transferase
MRASNRTSLAELLKPIFVARTRADWLNTLGVAGIPCGAIKTVGEVCETPQLTEGSMVQSVRHRASGDVRFVARPIQFDEQPPSPSTAPPLLGQHTAEVLSEWLGWSAPAIEKLADAGAFGSAVPFYSLLSEGSMIDDGAGRCIRISRRPTLPAQGQV